MADLTDDELLAELGVEVEQPKARQYTAREERIIAGFEDIVRFYEEHGHPPRHGEQNDIFERLYAVRLDRLKTLDDCRELLSELDTHGLLSAGSTDTQIATDEIDDNELLDALGIEPTRDDDRRSGAPPGARAAAAHQRLRHFSEDVLRLDAQAARRRRAGARGARRDRQGVGRARRGRA